jgi:hypothetical protein
VPKPEVIAANMPDTARFAGLPDFADLFPSSHRCEPQDSNLPARIDSGPLLKDEPEKPAKRANLRLPARSLGLPSRKTKIETRIEMKIETKTQKKRKSRNVSY